MNIDTMVLMNIYNILNEIETLMNVEDIKGEKGTFRSEHPEMIAQVIIAAKQMKMQQDILDELKWINSTIENIDCSNDAG